MSQESDFGYVWDAIWRPPTASSEPEPLWTNADTARYLNVSQSTLTKLRCEEGLPYVRLGDAYRYVPESIKNWISEREQVAASAPKPERKTRRPIRSAPPISYL